jgi:hypothetical protein
MGSVHCYFDLAYFMLLIEVPMVLFAWLVLFLFFAGCSASLHVIFLAPLCPLVFSKAAASQLWYVPSAFFLRVVVVVAPVQYVTRSKDAMTMHLPKKCV